MGSSSDVGGPPFIQSIEIFIAHAAGNALVYDVHTLSVNWVNVVVLRRCNSAKISLDEGSTDGSLISTCFALACTASKGGSTFPSGEHIIARNSLSGIPCSQSMNGVPFLVRGKEGMRLSRRRKVPLKPRVSTRKIRHESPRAPFNRWA